MVVDDLGADRRPGHAARRGPARARASSREQRVGIASGTRYEWILADLAIMCAGGATTTVYPSTDRRGRRLHPRRLRAARSSSPRTTSRSPSCASTAASCPTSRKVVTFDGHAADGDWVIALDDLGELGRRAASPTQPDAVDERIARASAPSTSPRSSTRPAPPAGPRACGCATTPGRTRAPAIQALGILTEDDLQFLWLPLAHSFGKVLLSTQLAMRLPDRRRRPGRQDRRQPRRRQADVHGRRAAHLREGARPDHHDAAGRGRPEGEALRPGVRGRPRGRRARSAQGKPVPSCSSCSTRVFDRLVLQQGARALRRPGALLHLRRRRAQPRHRRVVPRRRHR